MPIEISYITDQTNGGDIVYIYGEGFLNSGVEFHCIAAGDVTFTNELVNTVNGVPNEVRRRNNIIDYLDNGYTIPAFSVPKFDYSFSPAWTIHDDQIASTIFQQSQLRSTNIVYATSNGRTQVSTGYILNKPEIWNLEACIIPQILRIKPTDEFFYYGKNLSDSRTAYPSVWLKEVGQPNSSVFEITHLDVNPNNSDSFQGGQFVGGLRFIKKASRAYLVTSGDANTQVAFVAKNAGTTGNNIRISFVNTGTLSVSVSGNDITININQGVTTAKNIADTFNANSNALALASAFVGWRSSNNGAGTPSAFAFTNLSGGVNSANVTDGTYELIVSKDSNHYGVTKYNTSFTINTTSETFNTINLISFVYNGTTYSLSSSATPDEQTKALQAAMMAAYRIRVAKTTTTVGSGTGTAFTVASASTFLIGNIISVGSDTNLTITNINYGTNQITVNSSFTWANGETVTCAADTSKRIKLNIPDGHYLIDRPIIMSPYVIIDPIKQGSVIFQANPDGFFNTSIGAGYPTPPAGSTFSYTFTNLPINMFHLQGNNEFKNCKIIGTLETFPKNTYPGCLINFDGNDCNIENLEIIHLAIMENDYKFPDNTYNISCCFSQYNADRCRIKGVFAKCTYFKTIIAPYSGIGHIVDTCRLEGNTKYGGGVGRFNGEKSIYKYIKWEGFDRGVNFSGIYHAKHRSLFFECTSVKNGFGSGGGNEQILWECEGCPLTNISITNNTQLSAQTRFSFTYIPSHSGDYFCVINSGKGMGQVRRFSNITLTNTNNGTNPPTYTYSFTIDTPWKITPDANSVILVGPFCVENIIARCNFYDQLRGVCFYGGCHGNVVVDCKFMNTAQGVWMHTRRAPSPAGRYNDRIDINWHNYIIYNFFDDCDLPFSLTHTNYKSSSSLVLNEEPMITDLQVGGLTIKDNDITNGCILFATAPPPRNGIDIIGVSIEKNNFDIHHMPAIDNFGFTALETNYPLQRIYPFMPVAIGETRIWPIREQKNVICGNVTSTANVVFNVGDFSVPNMQGGSSNLWGEEVSRTDSLKSILMQPKGFRYHSIAYSAGHIIRSGNNPNVGNNVLKTLDTKDIDSIRNRVRRT